MLQCWRLRVNTHSPGNKAKRTGKPENGKPRETPSRQAAASFFLPGQLQGVFLTADSATILQLVSKATTTWTTILLVGGFTQILPRGSELGLRLIQSDDDPKMDTTAP